MSLSEAVAKRPKTVNSNSEDTGFSDIKEGALIKMRENCYPLIW